MSVRFSDRSLSSSSTGTFSMAFQFTISDSFRGRTAASSPATRSFSEKAQRNSGSCTFDMPEP
jgi:hypothetical protein